MSISITVSGYVGLVSDACFAGCGFEVICVDVDERRVEAINNGHRPFFWRGAWSFMSE